MKKKISLYVIYLFLLFVILELMSTYTHPELVNQIHKSVNDKKLITKGITSWYKQFSSIDGYVTYRYHSPKNPHYKKNPETNLKNSKNIFIFGDSVTGGFGVTLQDSFPHITQSLLKNSISRNTNIFAVNRYGHNLKDVVKGVELIQEILKKDDIIIFQFNFNDIVEVNYNRGKIQNTAQPSRLIIKFNDFRKNILNKSTFIRLLQHYAGNIKWNMKKINRLKPMILKREIFKKCGSLGPITLGQYTYSYGAKQYETKSKEVWKIFEEDLINLNETMLSKGLKFAVLISPISLQVSNQEKINSRGLNFECSTIDAREKIKQILNQNAIDIIDPLEDFNTYSQISFYNENQENMYLFHHYDTNHPNKIGHNIIGKNLYYYLFQLLY